MWVSKVAGDMRWGGIAMANSGQSESPEMAVAAEAIARRVRPRMCEVLRSVLGAARSQGLLPEPAPATAFVATPAPRAVRVASQTAAERRSGRALAVARSTPPFVRTNPGAS